MSNEPERDEKEPDDVPMQAEERGPAELFALGVGCLVVVIFFGAIAVAGFLSGR